MLGGLQRRLVGGGWPSCVGRRPGSARPSSRERPLPGSQIIAYKETQFDEYELLVGKVLGRDKPSATKELRGKVTNITYEVSKDRSTLEVITNYELALGKLGFAPLFQCRDQACGGRYFNHRVVPYTLHFGDNYEDQRFYAGQLRRPEGDVYASLYVCKNLVSGGETRERVYVRLDVIETRPMAVGMEVKDADELRSEITEQGHAVIHQILFAFDSADILPESRPALDEVGKLLRGDGELNVLVVGHTDSQGGLEYNMRLSERRAKAVVEDLVSTYGIQRARLSGHGVGFLAPVAPNTTEDGRRLNRRVELVRVVGPPP
jgi:OOP family OmpA-OmpF porin